MASISRDKNGTKRILFTDEQGKRRTIRLGDVNAKAAESFKLRVEALIAAQRMAVPLDGELSVWLRDLPETMHGRLAAVGLIESRLNAVVVTLDNLLNQFEATSFVKSTTRAAHRQTMGILRAHFGIDALIVKIKLVEAEGWRKAISESKFASATVSKHVHIAKAIFNKAVKWGMIDSSPFADMRAGSQSNQERAFYVTHEMMNAILEECPDAQWKGILALCRYAGLRCPSELFGLKWSDVNWELSRLTVRSPKTAGHEGHAMRFVPISKEVMPILQTLFDRAETGEEAIIPRLRNSSANLRTTFTKFIIRAGLKPWPRLFQNLRASCATDWVEQVPAHSVARWLGHSPLISAQHYLQVRDAHFELVTSGAKGGALKVQNTAQHPSAPLRSHSHDASETTCLTDALRTNANKCEAVQLQEVGGGGLEPSTSRV
ncbi:MAG: site-specific integrase [Phycisphaerales bacterium]|nr:site-specific integrase [Phycisphaerales bacterium]